MGPPAYPATSLDVESEAVRWSVTNMILDGDRDQECRSKNDEYKVDVSRRTAMTPA